MDKLLFNPISNILIEKYFDGKANIKVLEDIRFCDNIEDFFDGYDHVIIFLRNREDSIGHWVTLFKNLRGCFYFDSYGKRPIKILDDINPQFNGYGDMMNKLVKQEYSDYFYNTFDYQDSDNENISTCGRYVVLVNIMNKTIPNFDFNLFHDLIYDMAKEKHMTPDETVCYFISRFDKN